MGRLLVGALLKIGLPFMKNVLNLLAKSVLIPLGLKAAAAAAAANEAIPKKMFGSGACPSDLENRTT